MIPAPPLEREAGGRERAAGSAHQKDTGTTAQGKRGAATSSERELPMSSVHFSSRGLRTVCSLVKVEMV